jgi:hypothetical protein
MRLTQPADRIDHAEIAAALRSGANVAALVRELARAHNVSFHASPDDAFAAAVSRLSDAEVQPDDTEDLLVALTRARIISNADSVALHALHLDQTAG